MKDPKYLGIPNICFSLTSQNDKREIDFSRQRLDRGFDDSETWSLRDTIARFIIPRLDRYEELAGSFLSSRDPDLVEDIREFRQALELISRDQGVCIWTEEEQKMVTKGMKNFHKIFMSLWW